MIAIHYSASATTKRESTPATRVRAAVVPTAQMTYPDSAGGDCVDDESGGSSSSKKKK